MELTRQVHSREVRSRSGGVATGERRRFRRPPTSLPKSGARWKWHLINVVAVGIQMFIDRTLNMTSHPTIVKWLKRGLSRERLPSNQVYGRLDSAHDRRPVIWLMSTHFGGYSAYRNYFGSVRSISYDTRVRGGDVAVLLPVARTVK